MSKRTQSISTRRSAAKTKTAPKAQAKSTARGAAESVKLQPAADAPMPQAEFEYKLLGPASSYHQTILLTPEEWGDLRAALRAFRGNSTVIEKDANRAVLTGLQISGLRIVHIALTQLFGALPASQLEGSPRVDVVGSLQSFR